MMRKSSSVLLGNFKVRVTLAVTCVHGTRPILKQVCFLFYIKV